jgi:hypothetical protein
MASVNLYLLRVNVECILVCLFTCFKSVYKNFLNSIKGQMGSLLLTRCNSET